MPGYVVFSQGGPVMYVLLALSVGAVAIIVLKVLQFSSLRLRRGESEVDEALGLALRGDSSAAMDTLRACPSPLARVVEASLAASLDEKVTAEAADAELGRVGTAELRRLESWLRALSSIAHLSPLLGLLGTVSGMIGAFQKVEQLGGQVDAAVLSGGIWEALLTTAFGLTVAIPAMAAFYALESEVDRVRASMKDRSLRVLLHFGKIAAGADELEQAAVAREDYGV